MSRPVEDPDFEGLDELLEDCGVAEPDDPDWAINGPDYDDVFERRREDQWV